MTALERLRLTASNAALADKLDAPDNDLERARNRVEAIRRELVRRSRDRVAGRRYAAWLNGATGSCSTGRRSPRRRSSRRWATTHCRGSVRPRATAPG